jgi:hypothetical protein
MARNTNSRNLSTQLPFGNIDPSLRANGSRECALDDRLREAIQSCVSKILDCFVAYAPRNDE